jgi:hypothetical protein
LQSRAKRSDRGDDEVEIIAVVNLGRHLFDNRRSGSAP